MSDDFYRAFEERYYAPRDVIKNLRRQYLPFVEPLAAACPGGRTFDLGCGRGEWLELMLEQGLAPFGVDLDAGMLQACQELGLPAIQGDAVKYLRSLASDSQVLVSAFHVVEHISFEQLQVVVSEALRVLCPGGLLIFETPNPESIAVGTDSFYLDPTHQKPIPSKLLSFVVEHSGFETVKVIRLQESPALRDPSRQVRLLDVIRGVSPDYAVVAQKAARPEQKEQFAQAFASEYGLSLEQLAGRYEDQLDALRKRMGKAEAAVVRSEIQLKQMDLALQQATSMFKQTEDQLQAVHDSTSWRLTAPLRWFVHQARLLLRLGVRARSKALIKKVLRKPIDFLDGHPALRSRVVVMVNSVGLGDIMKKLYEKTRGPRGDAVEFLATGRRYEQLSPYGKEIHRALEAAGQYERER